MIIVITEIEKGFPIVSHGIDFDTHETIVLPPVRPDELGAKFSMLHGEWVLVD